MDINLLPIRSFSPDQDIPWILSLRASVEAVDNEGLEISEQSLFAQLNLPGHDPVHDRWVIDAPDGSSSLIASAIIILPPGANIADANIVVHPDWRHLGVEDVLLSRIIERAKQLKTDSIQFFANARHPDTPVFLHRNGFISQGTYTELRLTKDIRLPPVIWPYGYTVHPYSEILDLSILTQAMNLSYIPLWGHREVTENEMVSWLPDFNQQGLFLVFSEKGRVIGISRVEPSPERTRKNGNPTGYIDAPGVVPQHRRLDLYRALVLTGINWLHNQNQTLIEMESWGDKLEVLKMYRELGFMDIRQLVSYELKLITETLAR
jgi:ribosomal protein S18 acetylase RimI-like enzyme